MCRQPRQLSSTSHLQIVGIRRQGHSALISPACHRTPGTPDLSQPRTILAFDFGLRRIGVAVGQDVTGSASPLGVVNNRETGVDFDGVAALINEWRPTLLVVGM